MRGEGGPLVRQEQKVTLIKAVPHGGGGVGGRIAGEETQEHWKTSLIHPASLNVIIKAANEETVHEPTNFRDEADCSRVFSSGPNEFTASDRRHV